MIFICKSYFKCILYIFFRDKNHRLCNNLLSEHKICRYNIFIRHPAYTIRLYDYKTICLPMEDVNYLRQNQKTINIPIQPQQYLTTLNFKSHSRPPSLHNCSIFSAVE